MQEKGLSLTPEEVATLKEQLYRIIHTLEK